MKLAINMDSDCIITNMWGEVFRRTNETFGTSYNESHVVDYNIQDCPAFEQSHKDYMQDLLNSDGFFATFEAYPGALEALQILNELHDVTICTSYAWSSDTCANDKLAWYAEHAPFISRKQFLLGHPKYKIICDVAIDDGPDKCRKYRNAQSWCNILSIHWPYHDAMDDRDDVYDFLAENCHDFRSAWKEMLKVIAYISEHSVGSYDRGPLMHTRVPINPVDVLTSDS